MTRIEITLPDRFIFSTDIPIRISDINRGGHLSWNAMFGILDEASVRFWDKFDRREAENESVSHITVDAGINYKRQAFYGQTLRVEIGAIDFSSKGFDLVFKVTELSGGTEIARAKAGILCYDYQNNKVIAIPETLRNRLMTS